MPVIILEIRKYGQEMSFFFACLSTVKSVNFFKYYGDIKFPSSKFQDENSIQIENLSSKLLHVICCWSISSMEYNEMFSQFTIHHTFNQTGN